MKKITKRALIRSLLRKERVILREKLKHHFTIEPAKRNYEEFEKIVDKLDIIRELMWQFK